MTEFATSSTVTPREPDTQICDSDKEDDWQFYYSDAITASLMSKNSRKLIAPLLEAFETFCTQTLHVLPTLLCCPQALLHIPSLRKLAEEPLPSNELPRYADMLRFTAWGPPRRWCLS